MKAMTAFICALLVFIIWGCNTTECCKVQTKTITIYENDTIPANIGISTGVYTNVDGYRYVNIAVEFEQNAANESPVSLGVVFAHSSTGQWGAGRYFTFEENFSAPANPQMITLTGGNSWHGPPHNKSSYIARLPIMGLYLQVFPFNHHSETRRFSIVLYLTT
jgi:hypothetical protein